MFTIRRIDAMEILDSRGRPTVWAACDVATDGRAAPHTGAASAPSGASTGAAEALELRDGDPKRYAGLGCRTAVANITGPIAQAIVGQTFTDQAALDQTVAELDGSPNHANLGANAALAVSLAFARACAAALDKPLYQHFADMLGQPLATLPRLTVNLFSGGKHAGGQVPIQDVLVVPLSARTIDQALAMTYAVYQAAAEIGRKRYNARALTADEGGLAPPFGSVAQMLDDAVDAISNAGLLPGRDGDMALAVDVAASHFHYDGRYHLGNAAVDSPGMIEQVADWVRRWPIISVEDGLAEDDWAHWPALRQAIAGQAITLGDDLLCTNPARIQRAIDSQAADALLLKVNQIGSLTQAAAALKLARTAGWQITISARSGETEDHWLADLATGWAGNHIKIGSITQSERLAKYNRLLAIERETGLAAPGPHAPASSGRRARAGDVAATDVTWRNMAAMLRGVGGEEQFPDLHHFARDRENPRRETLRSFCQYCCSVSRFVPDGDNSRTIARVVAFVEEIRGGATRQDAIESAWARHPSVAAGAPDSN